ncbi:MAG: 2Fe-2S iron-sulfur cluster-binding protein [Geminicoccaceae bacterium]
MQAVRATGLQPPFSCESGVCGACQAHLSNGTVHMRARMALDNDDAARGAILTCQSLPTSERIELSYDKRRVSLPCKGCGNWQCAGGARRWTFGRSTSCMMAVG